LQLSRGEVQYYVHRKYPCLCTSYQSKYATRPALEALEIISNPDAGPANSQPPKRQRTVDSATQDEDSDNDIVAVENQPKRPKFEVVDLTILNDDGPLDPSGLKDHDPPRRVKQESNTHHDVLKELQEVKKQMRDLKDQVGAGPSKPGRATSRQHSTEDDRSG
jgi:hypothetical protein